MTRKTWLFHETRLAVVLTLLVPAVAMAGEGTNSTHGPVWWLIGLFTFQGLLIWLFTRRRYLVMKDGEFKPAFQELQQFSIFLLAGAVVAQLWIHGEPDAYHATMGDVLWTVPWIHVELTLHFLANEVLMTFFFGIAAKELTEATLQRDGPLRGIRGFLPMMACLGGVVGPALVYRMICTRELAGAWAVPCATDIAFAWLGARAIWGPKHPAVTFLLALAVADDFIGMGIIAVFYPQRDFNFVGLLLIAFGMALAFACNRAGRRIALLGIWQAFIVPGAICWLGLHLAGLHAALALVFVVPFIPMHDHDDGLFASGDDDRPDALNRFEHAHKPFVDVGLFYFGLANAGVAWWGTGAWDQNSTAVFLGLGLGKTLGITAMTVLGFLLLKLTRGTASLPTNAETGERLAWRDVPLIGLLGAMGFTGVLFVAAAAGCQASLKLGALASFIYLGLAVALGKTLRHSP